jgi:hypothetical protein
MSLDVYSHVMPPDEVPVERLYAAVVDCVLLTEPE